MKLDIKSSFVIFHVILLAILFVIPPVSSSETKVPLKYDRATLEKKWKNRMNGFLKDGVIPLIDLESSLARGFGGKKYLKDTIRIMDKEGVALIAFFTFQAPKENKNQKGYRWNYYIHELVNEYPDHFILSTNGGVNNNWFKQKKSYIQQLEQEIKTGEYALISEIEFRHYMSDLQCTVGRKDRDHLVPLDSKNGHRLFGLSQKTDVAAVIHFEMEDALLDSLEEMLEKYPKAKIIIAHFGQIRYPHLQKRFGPELVRELLEKHPNLYFDLSTGEPGRRYTCTNELDTVIWQDGILGSQKGSLKPEYSKIFTEFSDRFVAGFDYGGGNIRISQKPKTEKLSRRIKNVRLIMKGLPEEAQHNIAYRNAWYLLTGKKWH